VQPQWVVVLWSFDKRGGLGLGVSIRFFLGVASVRCAEENPTSCYWSGLLGTPITVPVSGPNLIE